MNAAALNKLAQLMVVVVGFFVAVQLVIVQVVSGATPPMRAAITLAFALGLAVRYWWVILLLPWPARWFRMVLLLLVWSAMPVVAISSADRIRWALALAALSALGSITEAYNYITRQWQVASEEESRSQVGPEEASRSLKRDHVAGAVMAGLATVLLILAASFLPQWLDVLIPLMVLADWARLIVMIQRHQRFIDLGYLT